MKSKQKIFILLLLITLISFTSLPISAAPTSITILDDMDGNYSPTSTENLTLNAQNFYRNNGGFLFTNAIDSTLAMPTTGDTAVLYYSAHSFESIEVSWYSSFGAFVTKKNGMYQVGGDPAQALQLPLYISDMDGETHFYITNSSGAVFRTDYGENANTPTLGPFYGITSAEVLSMKQVGASALANHSSGWSVPSTSTYSVTLDTGADPPLYYHTLSISLPTDISTVKVSGLDLFPTFADSYYFDLPILTALARIRATGNFSFSSSENTSLDSTEILSSHTPSISDLSNSLSSSFLPNTSSSTSFDVSSQINSESSSETSNFSFSLSSTNESSIPFSSTPNENPYPWYMTAENSVAPSDRGRSIAGNNQQIEGYIPSVTNNAISALESTEPNFNPNWGGTRIIRPHTTLSKAEVSSFEAETNTSSYTIITGSTSTQNSSTSSWVLLGVSTASLVALGFMFWKTRKP